jgi:FMN phosphatase YigB (HAD superfamily)
MTDKKNVLNGVQSVVLDLDGTLYDKTGLARRMVRRLWWCLPLLAAERLSRRNAHYVQFASEEEFFSYFYATMARGHWWNAGIARMWYDTVYMPAMLRLIKSHCHPNFILDSHIAPPFINRLPSRFFIKTTV